MKEEDSSTPIASSRRRPPPLRRGVPPVKAAGGKTLSWKSPIQDDGPLTSSPTMRDPPPGDNLGRLSLAQNSIRQLRRELAEKEEELAMLREEKEKYETGHGKIYSQMSSVRNKCQAYEDALMKKSGELETASQRNDELERECGRLRNLFVEETAKHSLRTRSLEGQVATLKAELEMLKKTSERHPSQSSPAKSIKDQGLRTTVEGLKSKLQEELESKTKEIIEYRLQKEELTRKLEEARSALIKINTEKTCLVTDLRKLQEELIKAHRRLEKKRATENETGLRGELEQRLAALETERSNVKNALKKAMAVLDKEEEWKRELDVKDARIYQLEEMIKTYSVPLPSIDTLNASLQHMRVEPGRYLHSTQADPKVVDVDRPRAVELPPVSPEDRLKNVSPPAILDKEKTAELTSPTFALPMAPIKATGKPGSDTVEDIKSKLSALREANTRLRQLGLMKN